MPVCCGCSGLNVVPMGRRGRLECVTLLAGAGAFVNAALGLPGWLWCVLRLRGIRGRVCERRAWFAGMVVVCVTFAWVCVAFRGL